ncbi:MAG: V4R domain-containing protein [Candidatus Bathyarchaeia archaeon]
MPIEEEESELIRTEGELRLWEGRCAIFSASAFLHLFLNLKNFFGIVTATTLLYNTGKEVAQSTCQKFAEKYGVRGDELIRRVISYQGSLGYGKMEIVACDLKTGEMVVRSRNPILGSQLRDFGAPVDFFLSGSLAGVMEFVTGRKVMCTERKCVARGDDYCEFATRFTQIPLSRGVRIEVDEEMVESSLEEIMKKGLLKSFMKAAEEARKNG